MPELFTAEGLDSVDAADLEKAVDAGKIVRISHRVEVRGDLELGGRECLHSFLIHKATFHGKVGFADAHFSKTVDLSGCTFEQNIDCSGARFDGDLRLSGATIQPGQEAKTPANCEMVQVKGKFLAQQLQCETGLNLTGCQVAGDFDLAATKEGGTLIRGYLKLNNSRLGKDVLLSGATITQDLDLDGTQIESVLFCCPDTEKDVPVRPTHVGGSVLMRSARVEGQVNFRGARIDGRLDFSSARVRTGMLCGPFDKDLKTTIGGDVAGPYAQLGAFVDFTDLRITGDLILARGEVAGDLVAPGLQLLTRPAQQGPTPSDGAQLGGNAVLTGLKVLGYVNLHGVRVPGNLDLSGAHLDKGLGCVPIGETPTEVGGDLNLTAATLTKEVNVEAIRVKGSLVLNDAVINGSLLGWRAHIGPEPRPSEPGQPPPRLDDVVSMINARVTGLVLFRAAHFEGNFNLENTEIKGGLVAQVWNLQPTIIAGNVWLNAAQINLRVDLDGARIGGGLSLDSAVVRGDLFFRGWSQTTPDKAVHWLQSSVGNAVSLRAGAVTGDVWFTGTRFHAGIAAEGATIGGNLFLYSSAEHRTLIEKDVLLSGLTVKGTIDMSLTLIRGTLSLNHAVVENDLLATGVEVGTRLPPPKPEGGAAPPTPSQVTAVSLVNTKVTGSVSFGGARLEGDLNLESAQIQGGLVMRPWGQQRPTIAGDLWMVRVQIARFARLSGIDVGGRLGLDRAKIGGNFICEPGPLRSEADTWTQALSEIHGDASLRDVEVSGHLVFERVKVGGTLTLDGAEVRGGLIFHGDPQTPTVGGHLYLAAIRIWESTELIDVSIGRTVDMAKAVIGARLIARNLTVGGDGKGAADGDGSVSLRNAQVSQEVEFSAVTLGGDLDMEAADLQGGLLVLGQQKKRSSIGKTLSLRGAKITGRLLLRGVRIARHLDLGSATIATEMSVQAEGEAPSEIEGNFSLRAARLTGTLLLEGVKVGRNLDLSHAILAQGFYLSDTPLGVNRVEGDVLLMEAHVADRALVVALETPGAVDLKGATINGGLVIAEPRNAKLRIDKGMNFLGCVVREAVFGFVAGDGPRPLLHLKGARFTTLTVAADDYRSFLDATDPFDQTTYNETEKWLRDQGREDQAKAVHRGMIDRPVRTAWKDGKYLQAVGLWLATIGHRVNTPVLLLALLICWVPATLVFSDAAAIRSEVREAAGAGWSILDGGALALQTLVPIISFAAPEKWQPKALSHDMVHLPFNWHLPISYAAFGTLLALVGFVALPLLITRIVVVLRRQRFMPDK